MGYRVSAQELEFQETMIAERESEIREIETGIHELNDIFRDLGTIVEQQGGLIGTTTAAYTSGSDVLTLHAQITSRAISRRWRRTRRARQTSRRMACLLVILVIVIAVVLLAVSRGGQGVKVSLGTDLGVDPFIARAGYRYV